MIDYLKAALDRAQTGNPQGSLDTAVGVYKEAASYITAMEEIQKQAKQVIADIFTEVGATDVKTSCGRAYVSKPTVLVTYDSKGLTALCGQDEELRTRLAPYRKETERAGVLTIR